MTDYRNVLERDLARVGSAPFGFDDVARRRDRKRRNQRITAGVVGIAVFVAAVWIVTSVGSLDRSETPAVPGPAEAGPALSNCALTRCTETGPAVTAPEHRIPDRPQHRREHATPQEHAGGWLTAEFGTVRRLTGRHDGGVHL